MDYRSVLNLIFLLIILILLLPSLKRWWKRVRKYWKTYRPRNWKASNPDECECCRAGLSLEVIKPREVAPYREIKSRRGRKKRIKTEGYACLNPVCKYYGIKDEKIHALVGYGKPSKIQRWKCQACEKVFTSRLGTPLYYLKTDKNRVEMVLWLLVEGVDASVLMRYTGHCEVTVGRWLERMGRHSKRWHNALFRNLSLALVQMDELYTRVRKVASARWVWVALDPVSKAMVSLHIGGRTKEDGYKLVHDFKQRMSENCVPSVTTDGMKTYFYAITAHFGSWYRPKGARKDHWKASEALNYGQLVKRKEGRKTRTHTRMVWGSRKNLNEILKSVGMRGLIQTAFVERVNLTLRQCVSSLSRRTWSYAQTEERLRLHCEWFRGYYHFVRPHESLKENAVGGKKKYRQRTPAMALGVTDRIWEIKDLLHYPVPQGD